MSHKTNTSNSSLRRLRVALAPICVCLLASCTSDEPVAQKSDTVMGTNEVTTNTQKSETVWKASSEVAPQKTQSIPASKPRAVAPVEPKIVAKVERKAPPTLGTRTASPVETPKIVREKPDLYALNVEKAPAKIQTKATTPAKKTVTAPIPYGVTPMATKPSAKPAEKRAPYDLDVFRSALKDSKLQAPDSSALVKRGRMPGFSHDCFYLNENNQLIFAIKGNETRSELRQMKEWVTESTQPKEMEGLIKLDAPTTSTAEEYTFMVIQDSGKMPNAPLIRLEWRLNYRGQSDHIWATIRTQIEPRQYQKVDLGPRPDHVFPAKLSVSNNQLSVWIDGKKAIDSQDVSHWEGFSSYFKAGISSKKSKKGKVAFEALSFRY
ncbi:MAG: polysaccharide lyase family 7 protein [Opitutaceae bacterium]